MVRAMLSAQCQPLKHDVGSTFDSEQALLLFVGSGFTDQVTWVNEVNKVFSVFESFNMFASTTTQYTAFYSTTLQSILLRLQLQRYPTSSLL